MRHVRVALEHNLDKLQPVLCQTQKGKQVGSVCVREREGGRRGEEEREGER